VTDALVYFSRGTKPCSSAVGLLKWVIRPHGGVRSRQPQADNVASCRAWAQRFSPSEERREQARRCDQAKGKVRGSVNT